MSHTWAPTTTPMVAVKYVRMERDSHAKFFLRETSALARLKPHPNIMGYKGKDWQSSTIICRTLHELTAVDA